MYRGVDRHLWHGWRSKMRQSPVIRAGLLAVMAGVLLLTTFSSISYGAVDVPADTILKVTLDETGLYNSDLDYTDRIINRDALLIRNIRWPRVILAGLVGAGLALAGAALQGIFRSPLAEPGLIGVSSGAAVGAVTAIVFGVEIGGGERLAQAMFAFGGGLLTTLLIYQLAYLRSQINGTNLLLVGLAVNAIAGAYIGLMSFGASQAQVGDIAFWTLGSVANAFWEDVEIVLPFTLLGLVILPLQARPLNLMALGESEARYLGINVTRLRQLVMGICAIMIGVGVAFAGVISFVGLVVPHFIRLLFGPDHRLVLPASALGGAIFLITADLAARSIAHATEIPLGVMTTLVGGPFFLFLLLWHQKRAL